MNDNVQQPGWLARLNALRQYVWHEYGTAVLGWVEVGAGSLEFIDAQTINLVGGFLGPKWGPLASKVIQVGAGIATARRSVINRRRLQGA